MARVFISYSSVNNHIADDLCSYLEQSGLSCWIAPRDIRGSIKYAGEITRAIKSSDYFLLIFSKESSVSEHVKNEINLAINNAKPIVPYCLDNIPYDDDLEYYLSTRQRVASCGNLQKDFAALATILGGQPKSQDRTHSEEPKPSGQRKWMIPLFVILALILSVVLYQLLKPSVIIVDPDNKKVVELKDPKDSAKTVKTDSVAATISVSPSHTTVPETRVVNPNADTFSGKVKGGYPDGNGVYTFKKRRRIDMHDPEKREAEPGDYIKGTWSNGHLNYGEWYGADGTKKGFIQLGDNPDVESDHTLGKCVSP